MKYIFDSSFLLSLYIAEDVNHDKALEIFWNLKESDLFYINELTYTEILTVITYKNGFNSVIEIKNILSDLNVVFINSWTFEYVRYFEYIGKKISVVDISILYDSIKYDCDILSFDKDLMKLDKIYS